MGNTYNIFSGTRSGEAEREYVVGTPDLESQVVLRQLARARGLHTHVPDGTQNLVVVRGKESRAQALIKEAQSLIQRLYPWRFQTLGRFLKKHGLECPPSLAKALVQLEAEAEVALDEGEAEELPSRRGYRRERAVYSAVAELASRLAGLVRRLGVLRSWPRRRA